MAEEYCRTTFMFAETDGLAPEIRCSGQTPSGVPDSGPCKPASTVLRTGTPEQIAPGYRSCVGTRVCVLRARAALTPHSLRVRLLRPEPPSLQIVERCIGDATAQPPCPEVRAL